MAPRGEVAPGIAARRDRAIASTLARIDILHKVKLAPFNNDRQLVDRFLNFGTLANWSDPSIGIYPISPKTLRKHLEDSYEGGYKSFRAAVEELKEQLAVYEHSMLRSQKIRALITSAANEKSERATAAALDMTARYLDLLDRLRKLSLNDANADRQFRKHLQIFGESHPHVRMVK